MDATLTFAHRPMSDTLMVWTDIEMSDQEWSERAVRYPIDDDTMLELLRIGPSHNRNGLIFSGLQVVSVGGNAGWDVFTGLVVGDALMSLIVDTADELRRRAVPIDLRERVLTSNRVEVVVDADILVVKR